MKTGTSSYSCADSQAQVLPNVVYIGLQKSGSTYLRGYLYKHPDVRCTRFASFFQTDKSDVLRFGVDMVRDQYCRLFASTAYKPCRVDMYESIAMGYLLRGINQWAPENFLEQGAALNAQSIFTNPRTLAERIKAVLPDAKVIITIRSQKTWIDSNYRHFFEYLRKKHNNLHAFMQTPEGKMVADAGMFDRTVEIYDHLFGRDNVMVLPLEKWEIDETKVLECLCQFLGIRLLPYEQIDKTYNRGRSLESLITISKTGRQARGLIPRALSHVYKLTSQRLMSKQDIEFLACVYAASNARLSERMGYDLRDFGYPA